MSDARKLHLRLESSLDSVDAAELIVQRLAAKSGVPEEQVDQLGMAVREAMINAVSHGNGYNKDKSVHFGVKVEAERLSVAIRDEGAGFELDDVPDPLCTDNLLKGSGRGLLLMRSFVDELDIRRGEVCGTEVRLVKQFQQSLTGKEEEEVSIQTNIRDVGGVTVVDLSGRITLGEGSAKLRETVQGILGGGATKVLLNLGDVSYIDSAGLGELVSSYTTAANKGSKVKLLNVQKKVQDLLQITKLYTVFESFDDEAAAVGSFS